MNCSNSYFIILQFDSINNFTFLIIYAIIVNAHRLCRDAQHILACIRKLPAENFSGDAVPNYGLLDDFLAEIFGAKVGQ